MKLRTLLSFVVLMAVLATRDASYAEKKQKALPSRKPAPALKLAKPLIDEKYEPATNIKRIDISVFDKTMTVIPGQSTDVDFKTGCGYTHHSALKIDVFRLKNNHNSLAYRLTGSVDTENCMNSNMVKINYETDSSYIHIKERNQGLAILQYHPVISHSLSDNNPLAMDTAGTIYLTKSGYVYRKVNDSADVWSRAYDKTYFIRHADSNISYRITTGNKGMGTIEKWTGQSWVEIMNGIPRANILSVLPVPNDPNQVFAVTTFGLYRTSDGGFSWERMNFDGAPSQLILHHKNSSILFLLSFDMPYVSTDAGKSWKKITTLPKVVAKGQGRTATYQPIPVTALAYVKSDDKPSLLAFSNGHGIYRSQDNGVTWTDSNAGYDKDDGAYSVYSGDNELVVGSYGTLYRLKRDDDRWERIAIKNQNSTRLTGINGILFDRNAGGYIVTDLSGRIAFISGDNVAIGLNEGVLSHSEVSALASGMVNGKTRMYALVRNNNYTDLDYDEQMTSGGFGTYKTVVYSDDNGKTWVKRHRFQYYTDWTSSGNTAISVSPTNPNEVWVHDMGYVFASFNAGETWQEVKNWGKSITFDPKSGRTRYVCDKNPYKVTLTESGGNSNPVKLNVPADDIYVNSSNSNFLLTNGLMLSRDGGWTWNNIIGSLDRTGFNNGFSFTVTTFDGDYILGGLNACYGGGQYLPCNSYVISSNDSGATWDVLKHIPGRITLVYKNPIDNNLFVVYYNSKDTSGDDADSERRKFRRIIYSRDNGKSWSPFSIYKLNNDKGGLSSIVATKHGDSQLIYLATTSGLFHTNDYGNHWNQLGGLYSVDTSKVPASISPPNSDDIYTLNPKQLAKHFDKVAPITYDITMDGRYGSTRTEKYETQAKVKVLKSGKVILEEIMTKKSDSPFYVSNYWDLFTATANRYFDELQVTPIYMDDQNIIAEGEVAIPTRVTVTTVESAELKARKYKKKKTK